MTTSPWPDDRLGNLGADFRYLLPDRFNLLTDGFHVRLPFGARISCHEPAFLACMRSVFAGTSLLSLIRLVRLIHLSKIILQILPVAHRDILLFGTVNDRSSLR